MSIFTIEFAGSTVSIGCRKKEALDFLSFLFADVASVQATNGKQYILNLEYNEEQNAYVFSDAHKLLHRGQLGVGFAAVLYDSIIFHLINTTANGVALHSGAVAMDDRVLLLPGQSGAGKSTLTGWLLTRGYSYLTDELIFIPQEKVGQIEYLTRPLCLKPGSVPILKKFVDDERSIELLQDIHGAIMPHRMLNPQFKALSSSPSLIIIPDYQGCSSLEIEKISKAHLCSLLMGCHVNARNLENHGFDQILEIARSTPAYRVRYGDFQGIDSALDNLFDEMGTE